MTKVLFLFILFFLIACGDVKNSTSYEQTSLIPTTLALKHLNANNNRVFDCIYYPEYLVYQNKRYSYYNLYFETYILFGKYYIDVTPKKLDNLCTYSFDSQKSMIKYADGLSSLGIIYSSGGWLY